MLTTTFLTAVLSAVRITQSAPVDNLTISADLYNCGYVRTRWNSSVVAGIFALGDCAPFYYNNTIGGYQDVFAYTLYGGCTCRFYSCVPVPGLDNALLSRSRYAEDCSKNASVPEYADPTDRWHEPLFADPKPSWYNCHKSA